MNRAPEEKSMFKNEDFVIKGNFSVWKSQILWYVCCKQRNIHDNAQFYCILYFIYRDIDQPCQKSSGQNNLIENEDIFMVLYHIRLNFDIWHFAKLNNLNFLLLKKYGDRVAVVVIKITACNIYHLP